MNDIQHIHGHEIIDLVATHPEGIAREQLVAEVAAKFGPAVDFHACSAEGMDLAGLIDFLVARDKVKLAGGLVYPGTSPACEH